MSASGRKTRSTGIAELYRVALERRIEQRDGNLVCGDKELCIEVEEILTRGSASDILSVPGLDLLSVMEVSLQSLLPASGGSGLLKLAKAFEVLELATLNLYLCPWRKEYRVVKMYSGMFTHCIKAAFSVEQAINLFALLGYQTLGSGADDELKLSSTPIPDSLLHLACAFFTARIECQLLHSALGSVGRGVKWELKLVQERQRGHSLLVALENVAESQNASSNISTNISPNTGPDPTTSSDPDYEDLYTEGPEHEEETNYRVDDSSAPSSPLYASPSGAKTSYSDFSPSDQGSSGLSRQGSTRYVSSVSYQVTNHPVPPSEKAEPSRETGTSLLKEGGDQSLLASGNGQKDISHTGKQLCNCSESSTMYLHKCFECREHHNASCPVFTTCIIKGHKFKPRGEQVGQQGTGSESLQVEQNQTEVEKQTPKKHVCVESGDLGFTICYTCNYTHNYSCDEGRLCRKKSHNVEHILRKAEKMSPSTEANFMLGSPKSDLSQLAQSQTREEEKIPVENPPEKHCCVKPETVDFAVCCACNKSHTITCEILNLCDKRKHEVKYELGVDNHIKPSAKVNAMQGPQKPETLQVEQGQTRHEEQTPRKQIPKRHDCLKAGEPSYFICYTCNYTHSCSCPEQRRCEKTGHKTHFQEMPPEPMSFHSCFDPKKSHLSLACLTCQVLHTSPCKDGDVCRMKHKVKNLKMLCSNKNKHCLNTAEILCRYCCAQYCSQCSYSKVLECDCGNTLRSSTEV
ncbi:spermatogenesis associated 2-like [Chanos chanos]|uniref:Spermatogenesis associated 2-like n=1 Tax=Chanos chanos TaxID=29144 RepID=A0A6J2WP70_CHACN|nr:spermatogenesis-associated protein 2-like protein [Chanos chanos]